MKTFVLAVLITLTGCAQTRPVVPLLAGPHQEPVMTLVWVGRGEAERLENGTWVRIPEFDYEFSVEQRRYAEHWESVKHMHRRHPKYDGSAGERDQTLFFRVGFTPQEAGKVAVAVRSSLGDGTGTTDREFRETTLEMAADVSRFAPFNSYRVIQHYQYEQGALAETVELLKKSDGAVQPWVRNVEKAVLFAPRPFEHAPSVFEDVTAARAAVPGAG